MVIDSSFLDKYIADGVEARRSISVTEIVEISTELYERLKNGGMLITFGNGGSAADAQHFAAELSGRFMKERRPFPAIALSTNTSSITTIGNDYSYFEIFSRQVGGMCSEKNFVVGISTFGNSKNVVEGLKKAREIGAFTLGFTGNSGGEVKKVAESCIRVESDVTLVIQDVHIAIIHMICYYFDEMLE